MFDYFILMLMLFFFGLIYQKNSPYLFEKMKNQSKINQSDKIYDSSLSLLSV
jgi:hypothetical protein